eukprot:5928875-Ditylum_brightwellii.AAC.1
MENWDYQNKRVDLMMLGYINEARLTYGYPKPKRAQHAPHKHFPMHYGAKTQCVEEDLTEPLEKMGIKQ